MLCQSYNILLIILTNKISRNFKKISKIKKLCLLIWVSFNNNILKIQNIGIDSNVHTKYSKTEKKRFPCNFNSKIIQNKSTKIFSYNFIFRINSKNPKYFLKFHFQISKKKIKIYLE